MSRSGKVHLRCIVGTVAVLALTLWPAFAEDFPPFEEIWKKSQSLNPKPSLDTTPITVKVVDVTYSIPRNYFIYMDQIPTLKLTWPGLKALTEETRKCFGSIFQSEQAGCTSIEFHILGSRGPGPGSRALTNAEMFENFLKHTPNVTARRGPYGYDVYDTGPEDYRTETYRRIDGDIFFYCSFTRAGDGRRLGTCNDRFALNDGNHMQFFFRFQYIENIPQIEFGLRQIMERFRVTGEPR
jgi:hypothetical protein